MELKYVIWRADQDSKRRIAYIQRFIPKADRAAFKRPGKSKPDTYIKYSLGISKDWADINQAAFVRRLDDEYKKLDHWFAMARAGTLKWPGALENKPEAIVEYPAKGVVTVSLVGSGDPEFERPQLPPADLERLYGQMYLVMAHDYKPPDDGFIERLGGHVRSPVPNGLPTAPPTSTPISGKNGARLMGDANSTCGELLETFLAQRQDHGNRAQKVKSEFRHGVKILEDAVGIKPPHQFDEYDVARFYEYLRGLKSDKGERGNLSPDTIKKTASRVRVGGRLFTPSGIALRML